jgi:hypothetical protein
MGLVINAEHRRGVSTLATRELRQTAIGHGNVRGTTAQGDAQRPISLLLVRSFTHLLIDVLLGGI